MCEPRSEPGRAHEREREHDSYKNCHADIRVTLRSVVRNKASAAMWIAALIVHELGLGITRLREGTSQRVTSYPAGVTLARRSRG